MSAVKLPLPDSVVIPMAMNIGAPAKPVVKAGDYVKTGQLIGEPGGGKTAVVEGLARSRRSAKCWAPTAV